MSVNTPFPSNSEDEIDLKDLIIPIWRSRKQILLIAILCGILGGIFGFLTPATYTASSTFMPQSTQSGGAGGNLGGLAALAGINLNAPMSGGDIPPSMYATVLVSEPFRKRILDAKIVVNGDSVTYRTYLENQPKSGISTLREYTIGLPGKLIGLISTKELDKETKGAVQGLQTLSFKEYGLLNAISGKVSIVNDKKEGLITISVIENDPIIAAQVTLVTEKVLQDWIRDYKIKNSKAQYDFIVNQFNKKQKEFYLIQDQLASYMDKNQNVLSASYLTSLDRLQSDFELIKAVYTELGKQKEQASIQLSKDTPTFSVLDPVKIPMEKTGPSKIKYISIGAFLGVVFSLVWKFGISIVKKLEKKIKL